jgi:hypothetical protein
MRAHQPGSDPISIPESVPNPAYPPQPAPAAPQPVKEPVKVPEKVPADHLQPRSIPGLFLFSPRRRNGDFVKNLKVCKEAVRRAAGCRVVKKLKL